MLPKLCCWQYCKFLQIIRSEMLIYRVFKSIIVTWNILHLFLPLDKWFRGCGWISCCHFGTKCANHVDLSQIVAIRTTFHTNYFWNKSRYCAYLLFPLHYYCSFLTHPVIPVSTLKLWNIGIQKCTFLDEIGSENLFLASDITSKCWFGWKWQRITFCPNIFGRAKINK